MAMIGEWRRQWLATLHECVTPSAAARQVEATDCIKKQRNEWVTILSRSAEPIAEIYAANGIGVSVKLPINIDPHIPYI